MVQMSGGKHDPSISRQRRSTHRFFLPVWILLAVLLYQLLTYGDLSALSPYDNDDAIDSHQKAKKGPVMNTWEIGGEGDDDSNGDEEDDVITLVDNEEGLDVYKNDTIKGHVDDDQYTEDKDDDDDDSAEDENDNKDGDIANNAGDDIDTGYEDEDDGNDGENDDNEGNEDVGKDGETGDGGGDKVEGHGKVDDHAQKSVDICTFSPQIYRNIDCMQKLNAKKHFIFGERTQGRLLMFGDSTMWKLSHYKRGMIRNALKTLNLCNPKYLCKRIGGRRCDSVKNLQQQRAAVWNPPNLSLGEGPHKYGLKNPFCTDCDGCSMGIIMCKQSKLYNATTIESSCKANDGKLFLHGGYIPIEFARDVELQTPDDSTTQEVLATFLRESYNTAPLVEDFGLPICVVNTGHHDRVVATRAQFLRNVKWYVGLLTPQCSMIVWITSTAPATDEFKQTKNQTKSWNEGVIQSFRKEGSSELLDKLFVVDVHAASINYTHADNVHMEYTWYSHLGTFLYQSLSFL